MTPDVTTLLINIAVSAIVGLISASYVLGKYKEKVDALEKRAVKLEDKCDKQNQQLATLEEFKATAQKYIDSKIYKSKSPLSLTDFGKQLIADSGFNTIFEQEKDNLVRMLAEKHPSTKYDAQEMARALMDELIDYAPFQSIKSYAFTKGQDYSQILRAGAIPLRDYYLSQHPEITQ